MKEETRNHRGITQKGIEVRTHFVDNIISGKGEITRMDAEFQAMVQILIRITFRSVGRQIKHLDLGFMLFQPSTYQLAVVHSQIIHDEKDFPPDFRDHALHKFNQLLLVHGILVNHEPQVSLLADGGYHIYPLTLCFHRQNWWLALWRKSPLYNFTIIHTSFVSPKNLSILFLCKPLYLRVFLLFPLLDTLRILLPSALHRTLAT